MPLTFLLYSYLSRELCYVMNFYRTAFPYKSNNLLCTVLILSPRKLCKFEFYTIEWFKLIVLLLIIGSILNQTSLMECLKLIVAFIIDGGSEVDINMASTNVKNISLENLTNDA